MFGFLKKKDRLQELVEKSQEGMVEKVEEVVRDLLTETNSVPALKDNIQKLKDELADLKTTKKQELRDIEHLVKIKEKQLDLEHKEESLKLKDEYKDKEMLLQKDFHEKSLAILDTGRADLKEVYEKIMACLPNVNAQLNLGNPPPAKKNEKKG